MAKILHSGKIQQYVIFNADGEGHIECDLNTAMDIEGAVKFLYTKVHKIQ